MSSCIFHLLLSALSERWMWNVQEINFVIGLMRDPHRHLPTFFLNLLLISSTNRVSCHGPGILISFNSIGCEAATLLNLVLLNYRTLSSPHPSLVPIPLPFPAGHIARDCPYEQTCHNCRKPGHVRSQCAEKASCRNCGEAGHIARECRYEQTCQNCHQTGHLRNSVCRMKPGGYTSDLCGVPDQTGMRARSRDPTVPLSHFFLRFSLLCHQCPELAGRAKGLVSEKACHNCGTVGHLKRECPQLAGGEQGVGGEFGMNGAPAPKTCHGCGQTGHIRRDCPSQQVNTTEAAAEGER